MTPTPEEIALARRSAAHALCGPEKWDPSVKAGMFDDIMNGLADNEALVLGPLAAIMEVREKTANYLKRYHPYTSEEIRNGEHLR